MFRRSQFLAKLINAVEPTEDNSGFAFKKFTPTLTCSVTATALHLRICSGTFERGKFFYNTQTRK
jgi:hypothetical protein